MTSKASSELQLSAREMEILAKTWQCFEDTPKIDWQKLADIAGFKNLQTARACFAPIKKKLAIAAGQIEPPTPATPATPGDSESAELGKSSVRRSSKRKAVTENASQTVKKAKTTKKSLRREDTEDEDEVHSNIKANIKAMDEGNDHSNGEA
ncbi:hypothetical protein AAE478_001386 [Parahypoxylon ruwenzoriense]